MFTFPYSSLPQVRAYATRAHRMRGAAVAGLIREIARWMAVAAR